MADNFQLRRNPTTGQVFLYEPGATEWREVQARRNETTGEVFVYGQGDTDWRSLGALPERDQGGARLPTDINPAPAAPRQAPQAPALNADLVSAIMGAPSAMTAPPAMTPPAMPPATATPPSTLGNPLLDALTGTGTGPAAAPAIPAASPDRAAMIAETMGAGVDPRTVPMPGTPQAPRQPQPDRVPQPAGDLGRRVVMGAVEPFASIPEFGAILSQDIVRSRYGSALDAVPALEQEAVELRGIIAQADDSTEGAMRRGAAEMRLRNVEGELIRAQRMVEEDLADLERNPTAETRWLFALGDRLRNAVSGAVGEPDPQFDDRFVSQLAYGAGNMTGMLATALAGGPVVGTGLVAGQGSAMNTSQVYQEALASGASEEDARLAARWAGLIGASEIIPIQRALSVLPPRLRTAVADRVSRHITNIMQSSGEEAAQEALAQIANNVLAASIYDPERGWSEGVTEAAAVGAVLGAGTGAIGTAINREGQGVDPVTAGGEDPRGGNRREPEPDPMLTPRPPADPQAALLDALAPRAPQPDAATPAPPADSETPRLPESAPDVGGVRPAVPTPPPAEERPAVGAGRAPVAGEGQVDPERLTAGDEIMVSIGGQTPFPAQVIRREIGGPVVREADGTETLVPIDEIEDGEIVLTRPAPPETAPQQPQGQTNPEEWNVIPGVDAQGNETGRTFMENSRTGEVIPRAEYERRLGQQAEAQAPTAPPATDPVAQAVAGQQDRPAQGPQPLGEMQGPAPLGERQAPQQSTQGNALVEALTGVPANDQSPGTDLTPTPLEADTGSRRFDQAGAWWDSLTPEERMAFLRMANPNSSNDDTRRRFAGMEWADINDTIRDGITRRAPESAFTDRPTGQAQAAEAAPPQPGATPAPPVDGPQTPEQAGATGWTPARWNASQGQGATGPLPMADFEAGNPGPRLRAWLNAATDQQILDLPPSGLADNAIRAEKQRRGIGEYAERPAPTNQDMLQAAQDSGRLEIVDGSARDRERMQDREDAMQEEAEAALPDGYALESFQIGNPPDVLHRATVRHERSDNVGRGQGDTPTDTVEAAVLNERRTRVEGNETEARLQGREDMQAGMQRRLPPYIDITDAVARDAWTTGWDEANLAQEVPGVQPARDLPDLSPRDRRAQWNAMSPADRERLLRSLGGFDKRDGNLTRGGQNAVRKNWQDLSPGARGKIEEAWREMEDTEALLAPQDTQEGGEPDGEVQGQGREEAVDAASGTANAEDGSRRPLDNDRDERVAQRIADVAGGYRTLERIREEAREYGFQNLAFAFDRDIGGGKRERIWIDGRGVVFSNAKKSTPKEVRDGQKRDALSAYISVPASFRPENLFVDADAAPASPPSPSGPVAEDRRPDTADAEPGSQGETDGDGDTETTAGEAEPAATVRLGRRIARMLADGERIASNQALMSMAAEEFGGTIGEGAFGPKDAYEALELGVNLTIQRLAREQDAYDPSTDLQQNARAHALGLAEMLNDLPTQTRRDMEQEAFQQFSTPPAYAYAVNWIANIPEGARVLEPSAGNGGIAVFAGNVPRTSVDVNELSERRVPSLEALGFDRVTTENAEQIGNIWATDQTRRYDVVVMNPPFSASGSRGTANTSATGARHIEQALALLKPGGRLVAIMGHTFRQSNSRVKPFFDKLGRTATLRANVEVNGNEVYRKYGTSYDSRVLVIDKIPQEGDAAPVGGRAESIADLIRMLEDVRNDTRYARGEAAAVEPAGQDADGEGGRTASELGGGSRRGSGELEQPSQPNDLGGAAGSDGRGSGDDLADGPATRPAGDGAQTDRAGRSRPDDAGDGPTRGRRATDGDRGRPSVRTRDAEQTRVEEATSGFAKYRPTRVRVEGAQEHGIALVESSAMASVNPPRPAYDLKLPKKMVTEGHLSEAQLEQVIYAGAAHEQMLPAQGKNPSKRKGYFIGDGTGVGKTREIAGIIADNWAQGRKRAVIISAGKTLMDDARAEFDRIGMKSVPITDLAKMAPAGESLPRNAQGVAFTTYSTLHRAAPKGKEKSRIEQLVDWLGPDFDGVIAFDEAHKAGNAIRVRQLRGFRNPSQSALAVLDLQNALPNARVVYASATGATEVYNLAYADRLGLWGPGTPFPNVMSFVNQIESGGIAAMEVVARDMKQLGIYMARSISYEGVEYAKVEHALTQAQTAMYDAAATAWQRILENIQHVIADHTEGGGTQRGQALGQFWGTHQRFFKSVLTSFQMPSVIKAMQADLDAGMAPVVQIVDTNESATDNAIGKMEEGDTLDDIDITPRDALISFLETSFPIDQFEEYLDDNGNTRTRPVLDSKGNRVVNADAVRIRDDLVAEMAAMRLPGNPLDMIINHFGPDNVAEVTGRDKRIIQKNGKAQMETGRTDRRRSAEIAEFMDGKRDVLIFSKKGGTGASYHAALSVKNQKRRAHYVLQAGWRADEAIQGFGRTHRTNQKQPPVYKLASTNLAGHKRFTASIARRLDQLGALTKGQSNTGGSGMFSASDNLESVYGDAAVYALLREVYAGNLEGMTSADFAREMGLRLEGESGFNESRARQFKVKDFLNRILNVTIDKQNRLFDRFMYHMEAAIETAIERGEFSAGIEEIRHDGASVVETKEAYRAQDNAATSDYQMIRVRNRTVVTPFRDHARYTSTTWKRHRDTGAVYAFRPASTRTAENGDVIPTCHRYSPTDRTIIDSPEYRMQYEVIDAEAAEADWQRQIDEAPPFVERTRHMVTGALLPIWDRLPKSSPKIVRITLDDGRTLLGREIPDNELVSTMERLGVGAPQIDMSAQEVLQAVMGGRTVFLSSGHRIARRRVGGEARVEIIPDQTAYEDTRPGGTFQRAGFQIERVNYKARAFIPNSEAGAKALQSYMQGKSIVNVTMERNQARLDMFYSPLLAGLDGAKQARAPAQDWKAIIRKLPGVKAAEIEWLGVEDWLDLQEGQVTREALADFVRSQQIHISEVIGGEMEEVDIRSTDEEGVDPDPDFMAQQADDMLDEVIEEIADEEGIEPGEVDREEAYDRALQSSNDQYWEEPDTKVTVYDANGDWSVDAYYNGGGWYADGQDFKDFRDLTSWAEGEAARNRTGGVNFEARFEEYTEDGGTNYREMLLTVPNLHSTGPNKQGWEIGPDGMGRETKPSARPFVQASHFSEPNIVVHARVKDRTGPNGERVLFIEEIQSDLASKWREASESPEVTARRREVEGNYRRVLADLKNEGETIQRERDIRGSRLDDALVEAVGKEIPESALRDRYADWVADTILAMRERPALVQASRDAAAMRSELVSLGTAKSMDPSTPDTPFKEEHTYTLMVKRLLREAAAQGYDRLAWTPGYMQAERWDNAAQSVVEEVEWRAPNELGRPFFLEMAQGNQVAGYYDDLGRISGTRNANLDGKTLRDLLGPTLAKRMLDEPSGTVSGQKITFPDSGYAIAYDQQIKRAVDKLAKGTGARVEQARDLRDMGADVRAETTRDQRIKASEMSPSDLLDLAESVGAFSGTALAAWRNAPLAQQRTLPNKLMQHQLDKMFPRDVQVLQEGNPVWSITITDDLRKKAMLPQPILQQGRQRVTQGPYAPYREAMAESRIYKALREELDRLGLRNVELQFDPFFEHQGSVVADHFGRVAITIGNTLNPRWTLGHEAIHVYKHMGVFSREEWTLLSETAQAEWMDRYGIAERYPDLTREEQIEEAVAEAFGEVYENRTNAFVRDPLVLQALRKIANFLKAVRNWARGLGMQTSGDIVHALARGAYARKAQVNGRPAGWESQAARLLRHQRKPGALQENRGALHLPDRRVWETLFEANEMSVRERLREARGAVRDRLDVARARIQDRMLPMRRAIEEVERVMGAPMPEDLNVYLAEEMYSGRAGHKLDIIEQQYVEPIMDLIGKTKGVTAETVGRYLYARHAVERNERIAQINPDMPDGGSGMSSEEAAMILAEIEASDAAPAYREIAKKIDALREWSIQLRVDAGLMTQFQADAWRAAYKTYVPLRGWAETENADAEFDVTGIGRGYNVRGQESQMAMGRRTEAFNPLIAALTQAQEAVVRSEKNLVGQHLYRLAKDLPSKNLWTVKRAETRRVFNETTGLVEERAFSPITLLQAQNEFAVKINGEEHRVMLHDPRLARSMGLLGTDAMIGPIRILSHFSRYFSTMNTMLNPTFLPKNVMRDMLTATINVRRFPNSAKIQRRMLRDWPKALAGAYRGLGGKTDTKWAQYFREFSEAGGKVSFWIIENPESSQARLERLARRRSGPVGMAASFATWRISENPALAAIERINLAADNAVRLAAFVAAREEGYTIQEAASLGKNLTVNFNRRGEWGSVINAFYTFSNAGFQGTHMILKSLKDSAYVRRAVVGLVVIGYLLDQANAYLSDEDEDGQLFYDKIPDYTHAMNAVLMLGSGPDSADTSVRLFLPYGYNVFPYIGNRLSRLERGVTSERAVIGDIATTAFTSFSPISGRDFLSTITPTIASPLVEMAQNRNFFGGPIYPQFQQPGVPDSQFHTQGATRAAVLTADMLNRWTGGTYAESGYIDVSPDTIDHIAGFLGGGAGRFIGRSTNFVALATNDTPGDVTTNDVPFLRDVYVPPQGWWSTSLYWDRRRELQAAHNAARAYEAAGDPVPDNIRWRADLWRREDVRLEAERMYYGRVGRSQDQESAVLLLNRAYVRAMARNTPYNGESIFDALRP